MKILVSNDDGWQAPGLLALAAQMRNMAEVRVIAPDRNRSAVSSAITLAQPIEVIQQADGIYSTSGTPADCVILAMNGLFKWRPDIIVSGINNGANLGDDVFYSGTVAAALEGRHLDIPAFAFSLTDFTGERYDEAALIASQIVQQLADMPTAASTVFNVNIPLGAVKGWRATRLGRRERQQQLQVDTQSDVRSLVQLGVPGGPHDAAPGTDFHAVQNHYVSITPIELDMTWHPQVDVLAAWLNEKCS